MLSIINKITIFVENNQQNEKKEEYFTSKISKVDGASRREYKISSKKA